VDDCEAETEGEDMAKNQVAKFMKRGRISKVESEGVDLSRTAKAGLRVWKGKDHPEHINVNGSIMKMYTNGKSRPKPKLIEG